MLTSLQKCDLWINLLRESCWQQESLGLFDVLAVELIDASAFLRLILTIVSKSLLSCTVCSVNVCMYMHYFVINSKSQFERRMSLFAESNWQNEMLHWSDAELTCSGRDSHCWVGLNLEK